ncbi:lysozyme [Duffyella gerundensis]|uniref:lysozyme n=1 Tax=Duffyella gerundensis TaxID=1619313 RepID=UPI0021F6C5FB|nr:lysozyme [Duffyella gerundensis]
MKLSNNGIAFIKREEGEKLTAYQDSVGVWTIGVGHTGTVDGKPVARGMTITQNKSTSLLINDLAWVESVINGNVKVPLTQSQYDALCSLVFNIGRNAFTGSTLLRMLNVNNYKGAADQFLQWKRAGSDPDLLLPRRKRERELFNT